MASEKVVIKIDLDNSDYNRKIEKVAKSSDNTAKALESSFKGINIEVNNLVESTNTFSGELQKTSTLIDSLTRNFDKLSIASLGVVTVGNNISGIRDLLKDVSRIAFGSRGLFGLTSSLALVSASFGILGKSLEDIDSQFAKFIKNSSTLIAIITGGISAALGFLIIKISDTAFNLGTNLVTSLNKTVSSANKSEQSLLLLTKTVENFNQLTNGSVGNIESFKNEINDLSESLNLSANDLNKAAQEIVSVGSQLGFTEKQLIRLLRVSAEYAKINRKDVFASITCSC